MKWFNYWDVKGVLQLAAYLNLLACHYVECTMLFAVNKGKSSSALIDKVALKGQKSHPAPWSVRK